LSSAEGRVVSRFLGAKRVCPSFAPDGKVVIRETGPTLRGDRPWADDMEGLSPHDDNKGAKRYE